MQKVRVQKDQKEHKIILASASPRRRELLDQAGILYEVCPSDVDEKVTAEHPGEVVVSLARQKAMDVAARMLCTEDKRIVLGADTVVVYEHQILGKPSSEADAARMLRMLGGHTHQVYTGVCFVRMQDGKPVQDTFYEKTDVTMFDLTDEQIAWYVSTGEPSDKAGAYGIQGYGAVFIAGISGDYNNVVGLPLAKVWQYLVTVQTGLDGYSN